MYYTQLFIQIKKSNWKVLKRKRKSLKLDARSEQLACYRRMNQQWRRLSALSSKKDTLKHFINKMNLFSVWGRSYKKRRLTPWWRKRQKIRRRRISKLIKYRAFKANYKKKYLSYRVKTLFKKNVNNKKVKIKINPFFIKVKKTCYSKIILKRSFIQTFTSIRRIKSRGLSFKDKAKIVKQYRYYLKLNANRRKVSTIFWSVSNEFASVHSKVNVLLKKRMLWKDPLFILSLDILAYFLATKSKRLLR
jgi:hypothetical protein